MKILVVAKRQYMGKDLLDDAYGRYFEIPECLKANGHDVKGLAISYRSRADGYIKSKEVPWASINSVPILGYRKLKRALKETLELFRPDVVWAGSDMWISVLVQSVCDKYNIPVVLDLYDNYESYGLSKFPFLTSKFKHACRNANGLIAISNTLAQYIKKIYKVNPDRVLMVGNAINETVFYPRDKIIAKKKFDLPCDARLIGTAGAINSNRDIGTLFKAFEEIRKERSDVFLVVAGPRDKIINSYKNERLIDLGVLPLEDIPFVYSALDVAIISNKNSKFGNYCYPQKFHEMIACKIPIVAADVAEVKLLLKDAPQCLYLNGNPQSLKSRILEQLDNPRLLERTPVTWGGCAEEISRFMSCL